MDETSLLSETDNNTAKEDNNPGLVPKSNPPEKQGYVSQWVDHSVKQAVVSGVKLRENKPICHRQQNTIDLAEEDEDQKKRNRIRSVYKQRYQRPIRAENLACTQRSCSPYQRLICNGTYTPLSKNIFSRPGTASSTSKAKMPRKCPLRIAELAEPSKRHCIETWRSKNGALPGFMLDRLKQHVMNQRPIARIPDAINCFKRKQKCLSGSKREDKMLCRAHRHAQREAQDMMEMKKFCAIFAQKLAKKLIKPMNISLSNEMEILSNIVAIEINKIISNQKTICVDYINDTVILKEMSSKVAIWIAGILDDAYYKLLEDDLRAKKLKENKQGKEGNLVTLIEKYILMRFEGHADLEEEEGPALDVLDTIVDKVVQLCTQNSEPDTNTESPEDGRSEVICAEPDESVYDTGDSTTDRPEDDKVSASEQSSGKITTLRNAQGQYEIPMEETGHEETTDDYEKKEDNEEEKDSKKSNIDTVELKGTEGDIKSLLNALLNEASLNVSEVFVVVSEDPLEEKTVKFSKVDMDFGQRAITDNATPYSGNSSPNRRSNIVFAPPNAALLYEADESWPADVLQSKIPTTASVSKSVTSLGLIFESDEKHSNLGISMNTDSSKDKTSSENEEYQNIIDELSKHNKQGDDNERTLTPTDTSDEEGLYSRNLKGSFEPESAKRETIDSTKGSEKKLDVKPGVNEHFKDDGKGDHDTDDDRNVMIEAIRQKMKLAYNSKPKFDYKVHPQTAPAWVNYNPSDDSIYAVSTSKKQIVAQGELRKWCRDLENTLINLQHWNNWIDTTCKNILSLKQATEMNNIFASDNNKELKEWLKLKRNIDKDAILWRKLNQRTSEVLGSYTITLNPKPEDGDKAHNQPFILESIFDTINMIDELSLWLHRLIVSTEYCVKCNCKKYSKRARKFVPNNSARS